ncbi:hypothetical protein KM043_004770 [Ampulex compressa]|nr:hypothetical protein KM043_004770 [Ampulex compressa]
MRVGKRVDEERKRGELVRTPGKGTDRYWVKLGGGAFSISKGAGGRRTAHGDGGTVIGIRCISSIDHPPVGPPFLPSPSGYVHAWVDLVDLENPEVRRRKRRVELVGET